MPRPSATPAFLPDTAAQCRYLLSRTTAAQRTGAVEWLLAVVEQGVEVGAVSHEAADYVLAMHSWASIR